VLVGKPKNFFFLLFKVGLLYFSLLLLPVLMLPLKLRGLLHHGSLTSPIYFLSKGLFPYKSSGKVGRFSIKKIDFRKVV
jgi:hypothetical protein